MKVISLILVRAGHSDHAIDQRAVKVSVAGAAQGVARQRVAGDIAEQKVHGSEVGGAAANDLHVAMNAVAVAHAADACGSHATIRDAVVAAIADEAEGTIVSNRRKDHESIPGIADGAAIDYEIEFAAGSLTDGVAAVVAAVAEAAVVVAVVVAVVRAIRDGAVNGVVGKRAEQDAERGRVGDAPAVNQHIASDAIAVGSAFSRHATVIAAAVAVAVAVADGTGGRVIVKRREEDPERTAIVDAAPVEGEIAGQAIAVAVSLVAVVFAAVVAVGDAAGGRIGSHYGAVHAHGAAAFIVQAAARDPHAADDTVAVVSAIIGAGVVIAVAGAIIVAIADGAGDQVLADRATLHGSSGGGVVGDTAAEHENKAVYAIAVVVAVVAVGVDTVPSTIVAAVGHRTLSKIPGHVVIDRGELTVIVNAAAVHSDIARDAVAVAAAIRGAVVGAVDAGAIAVVIAVVAAVGDDARAELSETLTPER